MIGAFCGGGLGGRGGGGGEGSVGSGLGRDCSGQMSIMNVPG